MAGKGDKPRPVKKEQYNTNYEAINWNKKVLVPKETRKVKGKTVYVY